MAQVYALASSHPVSDDHVFARARLEEVLLRHALLASYDNFAAARKPYPFADPDALLPGAATPTLEHGLHNTALVFLLDRTLPAGLDKHFRLRAANRATWANIRRLAPDLDLSDFRASQCQVSDDAFDDFLLKLVPLDYALMFERPAPEDGRTRPCQLTHLHVKVERLTDAAIKHLARKLGYIQRLLFERGEDYVDALEAKYYEYYGFPANASGRKSAAAMAAQLFAEQRLRFTVFAASQEDCRLCVLDETDRITQYMLVKPDLASLTRLELRATAMGGLERFAARWEPDGPVLILRAIFHRTAAAMPLLENTRREDDELQMPWLELESADAITAALPRLTLSYL